MSLKKPRDFKSQTKRPRSESERTADNLAERKNKRIKRKRQTSPVTSYISLKSDNPENDSRGNTSMLRVRVDSPTPTCLSLKTDWSMDIQTNFRATETFPPDQRLPTEHHLRCPLCKSMFKDPVFIPCGHSYCRSCMNEFWISCAVDYSCPQCEHTWETRPVLNTNAALAEGVKNLHHAGFSPALPPPSYAGPEDKACDFCTERRFKAVKCCSSCDVFLCETHIKPHYTIAALLKHTLSDVTGDMKTRPPEQQQNTVSFSSTTSAQQDQRDITLDTEMAVGNIVESILKLDKLQTQPKKSAKPKTRDNKEVKSLVLMCSTIKKEVSGLRKQLSKISKTKNAMKEKRYEEDYEKEEDEEEDCSENDSERSDDDDGRDYDSYAEEEDGSEHSYAEEEDGSEHAEEEDGSEHSYAEEEDGSEHSYTEEEDGSEHAEEEDGYENSFGTDEDGEENSAYSDEECDDKYSVGNDDRSSEEYSTEDEDDDY